MRVDEIDLHHPATQEDWYPSYRLLRDEAPVYRMPGSNVWVVTRYADVLHVLRHQDIFRTGGSVARSPEARAIYRSKGRERITPLSTNPPEHRAYRDLVDDWFDGRGAEKWRSYIQRTIDELIASFVDQGSVEIVESFALPLPVRVITRIMGFPEGDIARLKDWSSAWVLPFSGPLSTEQEVWVAENVMEFHDYISGWIEERRRRPGDDLISHLVGARLAGARPLDDHEIVSIVDHLYIGGNETTTFAITSALWLLLREPGLLERVLADRRLVERFLEESLRLESPTQGLYRVVAVDTELAGVRLAAGSVVHVRYAAANRDERMFPDPDRVDLDRPNGRRHMAFSLGEHHCPGSGLSRLEQKLAIDSLLDRLPGLRLEPTNDFTHAPGFVLRALVALRLEWDPERPASGQ